MSVKVPNCICKVVSPKHFNLCLQGQVPELVEYVFFFHYFSSLKKSNLLNKIFSHLKYTSSFYQEEVLWNSGGKQLKVWGCSLILVLLSIRHICRKRCPRFCLNPVYKRRQKRGNHCKIQGQNESGSFSGTAKTQRAFLSPGEGRRDLKHSPAFLCGMVDLKVKPVKAQIQKGVAEGEFSQTPAWVKNL